MENQGQTVQVGQQVAVVDQASKYPVDVATASPVNEASLSALPQTDKNDPAYLMNQFAEGNALFFSTLKADGSRERAIEIYNAISHTVPLRDHVNIALEVVNYLAHPVDLVDEKTGELTSAIRVILVTEDGTAYAAVSEGVRGSITRLVSIVGQAPWTPALRMKAVRKNTRNAMYQVTTLELLPMEVGETKKK